MATVRLPQQQRMEGREVVETITRTTKGGINEPSRKLRYKLKVIQQPERARACGSGAKSSADRRPVDPPPVVELTIFEVDEQGNESDITFGYKANFFLFATLEMARPIAHGRVQPTAQQIPVLTGMPVSGMAYLDRPNEAGYFIFPDLSVRHEGKYKLSFNLYEQTKLDDDADAEPGNDQNKPKMPAGNDPDSSFDWRLEVKSEQFTVFSAKKFPGLAESTSLSRTVAEQGCRVRIRRDVRMRRRNESKPEYDDEEQEYNRVGRMPSQGDFSRDRTRSLSSEGDGRQPYPDGRRNSGEWAGAPPGGHLSFGQQQYQQPPAHFVAPMAPARPQFAAPQYPTHQTPFQTAQPPAPQNWGPQSAHPTIGYREPLEYDDPHRRASVPVSFGQPRSFADHYSRNPGGYPLHPESPNLNLPPLQLGSHFPMKHDGPISPHEPTAGMAPAYHSPTYERTQDRSYAQYPPAIQVAPEPIPRQAGSKRPFDESFGAVAATQNEPLRNGMRPTSSHKTDVDDDENYKPEEAQHMMVYKRAEGWQAKRQLPACRE